MKKYLSIFLGLFILFAMLATSLPQAVLAQPPAAQAQPVAPLPVQPTGSYWVVDPEVTFIGKNAARSGNMLDWTLQNYQWVCVNKVTARSCDNSKNPIAQFWLLIVSYIVVPLLFVVILASAMVIIITRGRSLTSSSCYYNN